MTSVPSPSFGANGFTIPTTSEVLAGVQTDMNTAFGGGLNFTNLSTPQGQLATSQTAIISEKNNTFLYYVSQVDPQYSQGFMQDAIGRIFYLTRLPATGTTVTCTCAGLPGTVIPYGAQALDTAGSLYTTPGGTIGAGGTVSLVFTNVLTGPIACAANTLTKISTTTPGWDSIVNPAQGTLGQAVESSQAFELRRRAAIAVNGAGYLPTILGNILVSDPVPTDAFVYENPTNGPVSFRGVTLPANSVYIAVQGGDPTGQAIALAIWQKKSLGCSYCPSTSFTASISGTTMTVTAVGFGTLVPGQTVLGIPTAGLTLQPYGTSGTTGTGGTGTYALSATGGVVGSQTMTAATAVTITDPSGYFTPAPTYQVVYTVPVQTTILFAVQIQSNPALPSDIVSLIQNAVAACFQPGGLPKSRIGGTVFASSYYGAIQATDPAVNILSVLIGTSSPTLSNVPLNIDRFPVCVAANVSVTIV